MFFRSPTDIGKKRRQKTPCSAVTMERLEDFIKKWMRCELNGWRVLNDNALKEITSLRVHIRRGCLANIDPSAGTNRNENLHRHINPHFSNRSRIGLPIALALLTILLYRHNLSVLERMNDRQLPNIQLWGYQNATSSSSSAPAFGIQEKDASTHKMSWLFSPVVDIEALSHTRFRQACMNASLNLYVLQLVSMQEITAIFENALGFTKIASFMQKQSSQSPAFNYKYISLMSSVASLFFHHNPAPQIDDHSRNQQRLDNVLAAWGMIQHMIDGDGNCCFSAVAFSLVATLTLLILENNPDYFDTMGDLAENLQPFSLRLRQLTVLEWTHNPQDYEGFVPDVMFLRKQQSFYRMDSFMGNSQTLLFWHFQTCLAFHLLSFHLHLLTQLSQLLQDS